MTRLYIYGGILLALIALGTGLYWRGHSSGDSSGYARGVKDGDTRAATANLARVDAETKAMQWQNALGDLRNSVAEEKARADAAQAQAVRAVAAAKDQSAAADAENKAWQAKFAAAKKSPTCAAQLEVPLCAAFSGF